MFKEKIMTISKTDCYQISNYVKQIKLPSVMLHPHLIHLERLREKHEEADLYYPQRYSYSECTCNSVCTKCAT